MTKNRTYLEILFTLNETIARRPDADWTPGGPCTHQYLERLVLERTYLETNK